jgi:hypothetical protein
MSMTKKHYVKIAVVIKGQREQGPIRTKEDQACVDSVNAVLDIVSMQLAHQFADDNSLFDRARFLTACGVK